MLPKKAQKCLQIDPKCLRQVGTEFRKKIIQQNFLLPACLTPSAKRSGKVATATALIFLQKHF